MSLFQKIHSIAHNRHDVNMYIQTLQEKEKKRTEQKRQVNYVMT